MVTARRVAVALGLVALAVVAAAAVGAVLFGERYDDDDLYGDEQGDA